MRSARGLLLLAMAGILGGVAATYFHHRKMQARRAPAPPPVLPAGVGAAAQDWQWSRNIGSRPGVEVRAGNFRQLQNPERIELEKVQLRLYHDDGRTYDQVRCAHAVFDPRAATLYSDGEVEITMGLRPEETQGRLVLIRASGVTFHSDTGRVSTERAARFGFDQGGGRAAAASYDPGTRELHLRGQAELFWRGRTPGSRPMKLEAGELIYKEADSLVMLFPWSRLSRGNAVLEAAEALIILRQGLIREVEAKQARGFDQAPDRRVEYSAEQLWMTYSPTGELERLAAQGRVHLVATGEDSCDTARAERLELEFQTGPRTSLLKRAVATGGARLESVPLPKAGLPPPESRLLESEVIQVVMRPGGREVERVQTESPGRLEMLPNRPGQRRRLLAAERLGIHYGDAGRLRMLRAVGVTTRSDPDPGRPNAAKAAPVETWSRDLLAEFDPKTGQLARIEQWNEFRYREGARQARAERAVLDQSSETITLERSARVWDPSGAVSADRIELDQKTGDMVAAGGVLSTRLPDRKGSSSALLSSEESLEAQADRMVISEGRARTFYEGRVLMWQRANRLQAHRIELDRSARRLVAEGQVLTQLADRVKPEEPGKPSRPPSFVLVQAGRLVYTEPDRLAHYTGGVRLQRDNLEIRAAEIRAVLNDRNAESSLERAFADGAVQIVRVEPGRTLRASAEHAEYFVPAERVTLEGGDPALADSRRGQTRGARLTWLIRDDSFQVEGAGNRPVLSRIRRP